MRRALASFLVLAGLTVAAVAHAELIVSTGSETGTYHTMMGQVMQVCAEPEMRAVTSTGTLENIQLLLGNKVHVAFVQVDAAALRAMSDNKIAQLRTIVPMHPEEVHIIVPASAAIRQGGVNLGVMKLGGTSTLISTFDQLIDKKVGAWGGGIPTAELMQAKTIRFDLVRFPDQKSGLAALQAGEIDAIIAVGGQPLKWLEDQPQGALRLIAIPKDLQTKLANVYGEATLYYPNLGAEGLPTISTLALLVTRDYKTPARIAEIEKLRACIEENLPFLQEEVGMHPKWQAVDLTARSPVIMPFGEGRGGVTQAPGAGPR